MRRIVGYKTVVMNVDSKDNPAQVLVDEGWEPHGPPCAYVRRWNTHPGQQEVHYLAQAMVLYEEEPTDRTLAIAGAAALIKKSDEQDPALFWEEAQHVHRRILSAMPATDPYLFRWRYIAESKGWLEPAKGAP
jgi:hypothetical protein